MQTERCGDQHIYLKKITKIVSSGRRPPPFFRGQYNPQPQPPLPALPILTENPVFVAGADPTLGGLPGNSLLSDPALGGPPVNGLPGFESPFLTSGATPETDSPEFIPQTFEIQTEPQENLRPQVPRPASKLPEEDGLVDSR